jgi:hypothetical protein
MKNKEYITPTILLIVLDNEISLALESEPPTGPSESFNFNQKNPFKEETGLV